MRKKVVENLKKVMVSMPLELHERVSEAAKNNHRTMQDQMRYMLDTHEDMKER